MSTDGPASASTSSHPRLTLETAVDALEATRSELAHIRADTRCLEAALASAHLGYLTLDLRTGDATADARCAALLGYAPGELVPALSWLASLVHPEDRPGLAAAWRSHDWDRTRVCYVECRVRTSEGSWRHIGLRAGVAEWDADGLPARLAGTVRSVRIGSDESDLATSELRYRRLFEAAQDGILLLDAGSAEIMDANPYILDLLGYPYDDIVGRKLWEVGSFADAAASEAGFRELQRAGYVRYENLPLEAKGGRRIHVEFVSNLYHVDGQPIIQCNVRDITARRKAESELADLRDRLEALVEERTADLAEANAALCREIAERKSAEERARTLLVAERTRMAREIHDTLAQGLVGIIIQLEAGEDALGGGPVPEIASVHAHMQRARELARESLTEARRSVWALRPQVLEQADLLSALVLMAHNRTLGNSVAAEFACVGVPRALPPRVEDDLLRIAQEAVSNALQHAEARRVRIALSYEAKHVEMRVEDDGRGFDPSKEERPEGGHGLRSMRERAARIGGQLELSSRSGAGVTVRVVAPTEAWEEEADG